MIQVMTATPPTARPAPPRWRPALQRRLPARTAARAGVAAFVLFVVNVHVASGGEALWDGPLRVVGLGLCCLALAAAAWAPRHAVGLAAAGLVATAATGAAPLFGYVAAVAAVTLVARTDRRAGIAGAAAVAAFFAAGAVSRTSAGNDTMPSFDDPPGALLLLAAAAAVSVAAGLAVPRRPAGDAAAGLPFLGRLPVVTPPEVLGVAVVVGVTALRSSQLFGMPAMALLPDGLSTLLSPLGTVLVLGMFCVVVGAVALSPWFPRTAFTVAMAGFAGQLAFTATGGVLFVPPLTGAAVAALYVLARTLLRGDRALRRSGPLLLVPLAATTLLAGLLTTADQVAGILREAAVRGIPAGVTTVSDLVGPVADILVRSLAAAAVLPVLAVAAAWLVTRWLADRERLEDAAAREVAAAERARIARELHDVVAHHVSLVTVRAESAPFLVPDLPGPARDAFGEIAVTSRRALDELRDVLGVLGRPDGTAAELVPQPTLADVPALVDAARDAGARVAFTGLPDAGDVPSATALAAHAVVREGLSNARRHAPGAPVTVTLAVAADLLVVEVTNPVPGPGPVRDGLGLTGLHERVAAAGGGLTAGPDGAVFRLRADLPLRRTTSAGHA